jgi:hypothetical protein
MNIASVHFTWGASAPRFFISVIYSATVYFAIFAAVLRPLCAPSFGSGTQRPVKLSDLEAF